MKYLIFLLINFPLLGNINKEDLKIYSINTSHIKSSKVILKHFTSIKIEEDKMLKNVRIIYKFLEPLSTYEKLDFSYNNKYEKIQILKASLIKSKDNYLKKDEMDKYSIEDKSLYNKIDLFRNYNRVKNVNFAPIEKGDIIDIEIQVVQDRKIRKDISFFSYFSDTIPIIEMEVETIFPKETNLFYYNSKNIKILKTQKDNFNLLNWTRKNISQKENFYEKPFVSFSSYEKWEDIGKMTQKFVLFSLNDNSKIKNLLKKIIGNFSISDIDKAQLIYKYIANKINYFFQSEEFFYSRMNSVNYIINSKNRNQFESLLIFSALLSEAGIKNSLAFDIKESEYNKEILKLPNSKLIENLFLCVNIDNKLYFFDNILKEVPFGYNKYVGRNIYIINEKKFVKIDLLYKNATIIKREVALSEATKILVKENIEFFGNEAININHLYYNLEAKEAKIKYEEALLKSCNLEKLDNFKITFGIIPSISSSYFVKNFFIEQDSYLLYEVLDIGVNLEIDFEDNKVFLPFDLSKKNLRETIIILPKNFKILSIPKKIKEVNQMFNFLRKVKVIENKIFLKEELEIKHGMLDFEKYGNPFKKLKDFITLNDKYIIFEKLN